MKNSPFYFALCLITSIIFVSCSNESSEEKIIYPESINYSWPFHELKAYALKVQRKQKMEVFGMPFTSEVKIGLAMQVEEIKALQANLKIQFDSISKIQELEDNSQVYYYLMSGTGLEVNLDLKEYILEISEWEQYYQLLENRREALLKTSVSTNRSMLSELEIKEKDVNKYINQVISPLFYLQKPFGLTKKDTLLFADSITVPDKKGKYLKEEMVHIAPSYKDSLYALSYSMSLNEEVFNNSQHRANKYKKEIDVFEDMVPVIFLYGKKEQIKYYMDQTHHEMRYVDYYSKTLDVSIETTLYIDIEVKALE